MKTIKFIIAVFFVMTLSKTSMSYNIQITQPYPCADDPFALVYPDSVIQVQFRVKRNLPTDEDLYLYEIFAEQHGASILMYQYSGLVDEYRSDPISLARFPGTRFNEPMNIKIRVRPYNLELWQEKKGYLVYYKNGPGYTYRSITYGQSQEIAHQQTVSFTQNGCMPLPPQMFIHNKYKITFTLNGQFSLNDSMPQIVSSLCAGYNHLNLNNQERYGEIVSMSSTRIVFATYIYQLWDISGMLYMGYYPTHPLSAAITYVWARKPVLDSVSAFPQPFPLGATSIMYNHSRNVNSVTNYTWIDSFNVHGFGFEPAGRYALVHYYHLPGNPLENLVENFKVYSKTWNNYFSSEWKWMKPSFGGPYNGCPFVEYNISGYKIHDNTILNQSGYFNGDIDDPLILGNPMLPDTDTIKFKIVEIGDSKTEIDKLGLLQVNVNRNEGIGVTTDGTIVNYDKNSLTKGKFLLNSSEDLSDVLYAEDNIEKTFQPGDKLEIDCPVNEEGFLIIVDYVPLNKEKHAGVLENQKGEKITVFSRSNKNISCIKIDPEASSHLTYSCEQKHVVDMIAFVKNLKTAEVNELTLLEASLNGKNNVESLLKNDDGNFVRLTPGVEINLAYENLHAEEKNAFYILNSNGHIETTSENRSEVDTPAISGYEFRLFENNPDPFNPVTKIKFEIPENGIAKLSVFDLSGREIKTLINGHRDAGEYELMFDGSNLASGVYFYRLEFNGKVSTKKMMLIK